MAALCLGLLATDTLWARSLSVSLSPSNYNGYPISCIGARDGSIDATVTGGTPPYSYTWTNQATTQDITGLMAGYYKLTVVDGTLAMASADITLDQPDDLKVTMQPYTYPSGHNISCHDCFNGSIDAEKTAWGAHPYVIQYLDEYRKNQWQGWPANPYDMKWYFYQNGDPQYTDEGVFYYWKRRYKYMMSRWGYSVNLAAIESFNETDQILTYKPAPGGLGDNAPVASCALANDENIPHRDICRENRGPWQVDSMLPGTINSWLTDLIGYVRDPVDLNDPVNSPLGEDKKLFLMSYTDYGAANDTAHYLPFKNPAVDLMDVHVGLWSNTSQMNSPDAGMQHGFDIAKTFVETYPSINAPLAQRKPFNEGEYQYYTFLNSWERELEKIFHNYDVSFHNEVWASAFSGKFAAGTTWHWERVFWWPDALKPPPADPSSEVFNFYHSTGEYSNQLGDTNYIDIDGFGIPIANRQLHHHFKPLSDMLSNPDWQAYDFFNGQYDTYKVYDGSHRIESYYLMNAEHNLAIGWVHNLNAWVMNNYYLASGDSTQNFLGCTAPYVDWHVLSGFQPGTDYHVTWFPTRMDTTALPQNYVDTTGNGYVVLDLSTSPFGGTVNNYLDTLHADYAFIISLSPVVRSQAAPPETEETVADGWDFIIFPNPAVDELFIRLPDETPKEIALFDMAGRRLHAWSHMAGPIQRLPTGQLAKGGYYVRVSDGTISKVRKLIIR